MSDKIDDLVRKTYRTYYEDGLVESAVGFMFVLVGLALVGWHRAQSTSWVGVALAIGLPLLTVAGGYLVRRGVEALKQRVTYPRIGYVAFRRGEPSTNRWLLLVAAIALSFAIAFLPEAFLRMQFMVGALLAGVLASLGYRLSLWRYYAEAAIALMLGVSSAWLLADELLGTGLVFGGAGLALLVVGLAVLGSFLRRHPEVVNG